MFKTSTLIFPYHDQSELYFQLDLLDPNVNNSGDMTNYQVNGEFSLESFTSTYHLIKYSCCEEPYPDITYTIRY